MLQPRPCARHRRGDEPLNRRYSSIYTCRSYTSFPSFVRRLLSIIRRMYRAVNWIGTQLSGFYSGVFAALSSDVDVSCARPAQSLRVLHHTIRGPCGCVGCRFRLRLSRTGARRADRWAVPRPHTSRTCSARPPARDQPARRRSQSQRQRGGGSPGRMRHPGRTVRQGLSSRPPTRCEYRRRTGCSRRRRHRRDAHPGPGRRTVSQRQCARGAVLSPKPAARSSGGRATQWTYCRRQRCDPTPGPQQTALARRERRVTRVGGKSLYVDPAGLSCWSRCLERR